MNYIKHLSGFFDKVSKDDRLNPTHISLYVSLFQFWNACRFHNPISISRSEVMRISKICSKATYHKCIRELNDGGYLHYEPSYNPFKGSLVYLFDFRTGTEQALNMERTKKQESTEQALVPYINNTNNNKLQTKVNERAHTQKSQNENIKNSKDQKKKVPTKKKSEFVPPQLPEVREYFTKNGHPLPEADKFYNHFVSNGWLVSGKTPMKDWQAAANKWMLNNQKFNKPTKTSNLHANTGKDYSEAL
jgi:hypothetical protein